MFDPAFSDPPLLPGSPSYLLIKHIVWSHSAHAQFGFFFSWESACDQHRANQHCSDRGQGFYIRQEKTPPTSFNQCSADTDRSHKTAIYCR
ncbi:unnamed protein product [Staurois parvus]|uniref:Uncharacterized protein n=1 Tax=Staurois parvus TaxID=386267 RepID=A0ABN9FZ87_9NEOB|nr:unnamed protein product [Staurois parvus]